ncbi:MAG TPA: DUF4382 domain-containing protein [Bacteroidota bacterium]
MLTTPNPSPVGIPMGLEKGGGQRARYANEVMHINYSACKYFPHPPIRDICHDLRYPSRVLYIGSHRNLLHLFTFMEVVMRVLLRFIPIAAMLLIGSGCDSSTGPPGDGQIRMHMVDTPADYDEVNITVTRVEVHMAGSDSASGWVVVNSTPATYDLLDLRNGASAVLGDASLSAGHYTQIRLILGAGCNVVVGGVTFNLIVASGTETGVKLNHQFEIVSGETYELTLDFDASRSIVLTGALQYTLKPTIRVQANQTSGSISGTVLPLDASVMVWTIAGSDTVSTAPAEDGSFKLMALPEGSYDVRFEPENATYADTTISGVAVVKGQTTSIGTVTLSTQ